MAGAGYSALIPRLINPLIKVVVNPLSVTRIELNTKDGAIEIPQILLLR